MPKSFWEVLSCECQTQPSSYQPYLLERAWPLLGLPGESDLKNEAEAKRGLNPWGTGGRAGQGSP
eukprot:15482816-Alexandrium_andersonii.AAC.1